jgi:hypothetical protein
MKSVSDNLATVKTLVQLAETMHAHGREADARAQLRAAVQHLEIAIGKLSDETEDAEIDN